MNRKNVYIVIITCSLWSLFQLGCNEKTATPSVSKDEHEQLNEDSIDMVKSYELQAKITSSVYANMETEPMRANSSDDAADDPAIWYNEANPSQSLIYGSNKKGGLVATDLSGKNINYYELGSINNVDILYDFPYGDTTITLLGCSNRTSQSINLFRIETDGSLTQFEHDSYRMDTSEVDDIYGFCFGSSKSKEAHYVFINGKNGLMQQYEILKKNSTIALELVRSMQFYSQTEGMVVDYESGKLYVGEEDKGIWMTKIDPDYHEKSFIPMSDESNPLISYDIEGLTIYRNDDIAYLLASSQGNFSYAVFDINDNHTYLGSFKISDHQKIDGVEETDGIDISPDSLNLQYPKGIFVAQDGFNYERDTLTAQNFKYVSAALILDVIASFTKEGN